MAQRTVSTGELPQNLLEFTHGSLRWCATESEKAVQTVMNSLMDLVAKADRIATIPQASRQLLERLMAEVAQAKASGGAMSGHPPLMDLLHKLEEEESQVAALINPLVEALQFQDRLQQNLETMHKILSVWVKLRGEAHLRSLSRLEVGQALLASAASVEEREIIRSKFPDLAGENPVLGRASMF